VTKEVEVKISLMLYTGVSEDRYPREQCGMLIRKDFEATTEQNDEVMDNLKGSLLLLQAHRP